ncbi:hypothetical protein [Shewanella sp. SM95]|uniref:hypothetical protein n=1 Tax=Shewanella sp. SM95 TaxID=2912812 RepID=UPI0021DAAE21|nr:hypothetical protein [Shewanella sp. SM95]MCU7999447.1 hypothetical protein [Shewanella sp. SM95]
MSTRGFQLRWGAAREIQEGIAVDPLLVGCGLKTHDLDSPRPLGRKITSSLFCKSTNCEPTKLPHGYRTSPTFVSQAINQSKQGCTNSKRPLLNIEHNANKHYGNKYKCQSIFTNLQEELGI